MTPELPITTLISALRFGATCVWSAGFLVQFVMPRIRNSTRHQVILLRKKGYSVRNIWEILKKQDVEVSLVALYQLIKKYKMKGYVVDIPRRPKNRILNSEMMKTIDE